MFKRFLLGLAFVASSVTAHAQGPGYVEINPPLPTDKADKIEVVEFFWYGCPHCYALEPYLESWVKKLPKDAEFKRVPAMFNDQWAVAGRVHYALEAMGLLDKLHRPLFDAIHKDGLRVTNERQLTDWLTRQGVDTGKFFSAAKSFAVESKLKRATQLTQASRIDGVPALMINGRYIVAAGQGMSQERMLAVADTLIEQSRKNLAAAPAKK